MQGQPLNTRCVTKDKNQSKILYAKWKYSTGNSIKISLTLQQNVFLATNFSEEIFFVTENLHLATKYIIRH